MANPSTMYPLLEVPGLKEPIGSVTQKFLGSDGKVPEEDEFYIKFIIPAEVKAENLADTICCYRDRVWSSETPHIVLSFPDEVHVTLRGDKNLSFKDVHGLITQS